MFDVQGVNSELFPLWGMFVTGPPYVAQAGPELNCVVKVSSQLLQSPCLCLPNEVPGFQVCLTEPSRVDIWQEGQGSSCVWRPEDNHSCCFSGATVFVFFLRDRVSHRLGTYRVS